MTSQILIERDGSDELAKSLSSLQRRLKEGPPLHIILTEIRDGEIDIRTKGISAYHGLDVARVLLVRSAQMFEASPPNCCDGCRRHALKIIAVARSCEAQILGLSGVKPPRADA